MKDTQYLQHGDLKRLAQELNVHAATVRNVKIGRVKSPRIEHALSLLIAKRKLELESGIKNMTNNATSMGLQSSSN